jgi:hypothetical protein
MFINKNGQHQILQLKLTIMKKIINQLRSWYLLMFSGLLLLTACNKALEEFPPIPTPIYPAGKGIAATIAATPNDSLYSRLIIRSGMASILNDSTKTFTIFATDNAGMRLFVSAASAVLSAKCPGCGTFRFYFE